ncbi:hypothetical protein MVES1_000025 [Malassezia vespertilionis]|uniref:orotate phosphoribosyltransferase n=1 Tax=Malassezia vespertilionis TaxID=2020962 RepID=A0A2N1JGN8_9BASI|nr:uncharacterized protein MVES1_000025 [Malassezia vespertilionis]PKI85710.1 Ura5p [Malassezia vespertilionis]WFD04702.1 hypothetical protein MVES1_000025 [Malassezia vespertilionis]
MASSAALAPYQAEYIELALKWDIIRFGGPYTLKSGRQSPYFFNAGLFDTGLKLQKMAECYADCIVESGIEFDMMFGPAYKGIPLVAATAMALAKNHGKDVPFCFNRKEAKTHGEGGNLVGAPLRGRVLVIDDVITAGTAINEAVVIINSQHNARLTAVVIALDRQERASEESNESAIMQVEQRLGVKVYSVVTLSQIIEHMKHTRGEETKDDIEGMLAYREKYGCIS